MFIFSRPVTFLPKTRLDVNFFALALKGWPDSGQSMPSRRIFASWPERRTLIVSPSETPTHLPEKVWAERDDSP